MDDRMAAEMNARALPGLWFMNTTFVPSGMDISGRKNYRYQFIDEICKGFRVVITDRNKVKPVEAGIHMLDALLKLYPEEYKVDKLKRLIGPQWLLDDLNSGVTPEAIIAKWKASDEFKTFAEARERVLLYR